MAELEVSSADVVRLVLQFLRENGLRESFRVLQEEAQQGLNAVDNVAAFLSDIKAGRWETVLPQVAEMRMPVEVVQDLLELVLLELLDLKDRDAARSLLSDPDPALLLMRSHSTDRFLRLERLVNKPSPDPHDLFGDIPKEQRRLDLSKAIEKELDDVAPSRLMVLIDQALRWQRHQGLLPLGQEFDLFKGEMLQLQTEDEAPPSFESAKIKFGKGVRCESIVFSPDGQYLVSGSSDGFLEVWNYLTGKLRKDLDYQKEDKFMSHSEAVLALCFSEDSELVASGCLNGQIKVWDIKSGKCVRRFDRAHQKGISCLSFSKDGSLLLSGSFDETLKVHGMKGGTTLKTMAGHTSYVNHCGWMEEGKVVSASSDGSVKVWDVKTSTCLLSLSPGSGSLSEASVFKALPLPSLPDRLLVCNHSPALSLLSLRDSQVIGTFVSATDEDPQGSDFVDCVLSPKGDWIFALTENGNLFSFRTNSPEAQSVLKVHDKSPTSVVHHPHRNIIATNGDEGLVKLWKP